MEDNPDYTRTTAHHHSSPPHHFLSLHHFLQKTKKRSLFALLSLLLFLLLSYNGAFIFSVYVPFPSKTQPVDTTFSPRTVAGKLRKWVPVSSSTTKLASSKLYAVKEENPPAISKTHSPLLRKSHSFTLLNDNFISSPSKTPPKPANSLPENSTGESRNWVSPPSSTTVKSVKEEDPPATSSMTHLPVSPKSRGFAFLAENSLVYSPTRWQKHKQVFKVLLFGAQPKKFAARMKEFFGKNSSNSYCKVRFFMTWISSLESFGDREFFSIEALFKSHPNGCLVIVSNSMDSRGGMQVLRPFLDKGFKVAAISPDYDYLFKNTVAELWFDRLVRGNVDPGEVSLGQNLSNLLRLAVLYKFGGIYIDTDFIMLRSFKNLRNVIGAQTIDQETRNWSRLNNAVMVFDKGHPLLYKFIQEFALTFDGNKWGHNGPYLVSRVVSRVSGRPGYNFTVLPPKAFYPVNWNRVHNLFRGPRNESDSKWLLSKCKQIQSESHAVHLWNKQSKGLKAQEGSIVKRIMSDRCIFCDPSASAL